MTEKFLNNWPNCIVPDCPNKCCRALNSDKCHPHTTGQSLVAVKIPIPSKASKSKIAVQI